MNVPWFNFASAPGQKQEVQLTTEKQRKFQEPVNIDPFSSLQSFQLAFIPTAQPGFQRSFVFRVVLWQERLSERVPRDLTSQWGVLNLQEAD